MLQICHLARNKQEGPVLKCSFDNRNANILLMGYDSSRKTVQVNDV